MLDPEAPAILGIPRYFEVLLTALDGILDRVVIVILSDLKCKAYERSNAMEPKD